MFPKIIRTKSRGRSYEYIYLCESVWKDGRSHSRTVRSLGRKDLIDAHLDRIYELCRGYNPSDPDPVPLACLPLGPFLALRHIWQELELPRLLSTHSDRSLVFVLNHLTDRDVPLSMFLNIVFACDKDGRRFSPPLEEEHWKEALEALVELRVKLGRHFAGPIGQRFDVLFNLSETGEDQLDPGVPVNGETVVESLASAVNQVLESKFRHAGLTVRTKAAWGKLEAVAAVEFGVEGKTTSRSVCVNSEESREVLEALGVKLEAPSLPTTRRQTAH